MITADLIRKIRRIEIITNRLVNDVMAGEYHSVFKGKGMEFDEAREYQPGDDVRSIDWNVTARMGAPFIKRYVEERELTVVLAVDGSASSRFGSGKNLKNETAAEICALLGFSAIKNNDRVGLLVFTDEVEKFIPPLKGSKHVLAVIRELLTFAPRGRGTNLMAALEHLNRVIKRKCVVFLISDFLDEGYEPALMVANRRHDLVAVALNDAREGELAPAGLMEFEDAETGEVVLIDTSDKRVRSEFQRISEKRKESLRKMFRKYAVDAIEIGPDDDYVTPLVRLFQKRAKRQ